MNNILELKNVTKKYPGVIALKNASLAIREGEVHASFSSVEGYALHVTVFYGHIHRVGELGGKSGGAKKYSGYDTQKTLHCYAVAASSFLSMLNITTPLMTQRAISTHQLTHRGTLFQSIEGMELR